MLGASLAFDYSHPHYGKLASNRREQRQVFERQLRLAVERGFPLVLHSRGADRDTLRLMRRYVPYDWKVHVHSYRGSVQTLEALLVSWKHVYIGFSGLLTLRDHDVEDCCKICPLERMVLETDAPYLPIRVNHGGQSKLTAFSHPGQIPDIAAKVAEVKGCCVQDVMTASRANTFVMYGI